MLQLLGREVMQGPVATRRSRSTGSSGLATSARLPLAGSQGSCLGLLAALRDACFLFAVQLHA